MGKVHVTDVLDYNNMRGFVSTLEDGANHGPATNKVFALDCEMCNTSQVIIVGAMDLSDF